MLTTDQYETLSGARERTDNPGRMMTLIMTDWILLLEQGLVEWGSFSTITFKGRVALAVYEGQQC